MPLYCIDAIHNYETLEVTGFGIIHVCLDFAKQTALYTTKLSKGQYPMVFSKLICNMKTASSRESQELQNLANL